MTWRDMGSFVDDQGRTVKVRAVTAMTLICWETVTDLGVKLPDDLGAHHGHTYVTAEYSGLGWNFHRWHCGSCKEGRE